MLISIIAPVYKISEDVLYQALECMYHQDFKKNEYEIILIDDGSPDNCGQICDRFASGKENISVIHTENKGVSHARNTGIHNARGEFLCFVDPDDYIFPDMLSRLYTSIIRNKADLVICNYKYGAISPKTTGKECVFEEEEIKAIASAFIGGNSPQNTNITGAPWAKLYSKRIVEENACYFDESLPRSQDNEFNFRYIMYARRCVYIDVVLYQYNIGNNSAMRKYWEKAIDNADILLRKVQNDINATNDPLYYREAFQMFIFGKFEDILYTNIAHLENKNSIKQKIAKVKVLLNSEPYASYISTYSYHGESLYRMLLNIFAKHKIYWGIYILSRARIMLKGIRSKCL